jgi:carbon starvation protein
MKLFDSNPSVGFLAQANRYRHAISADELIPPSADLGAMQQVMISNYINAALTAAFMVVVFAVLLYSIKVIVKARSVDVRTDRETAYVALWPQEVEV